MELPELTNSQLTDLLITQSNTLQQLVAQNQRKMPKTILKTIKPNVSIEEFISSIEIISISKLLNCKLPRYYALVIMHNLEKLESKNHPIVCTDARQKKFYCYSEGEWKIDKKFIKSLKTKIFNEVVDSFMEKKKQCDDGGELYQCMSLFFDVDKYPTEKLLDKICIELGQLMPSICELDFE